MLWSIPEPRNVRFEYLGSGSTHRMDSFTCNDPLGRGYIVSCSHGCLTSIHEHRTSHLNPANISNHTEESAWLYMPVDAGEYIAEIWALPAKLFIERALLVSINSSNGNSTKRQEIKTSIGRIFYAGSYRGPTPRAFTKVGAFGPELSHVFFGISSDGIQVLGFETVRPVQDTWLWNPEVERSKMFSLTQVWFSNTANLDDLEEVTPCRSKGESTIMGLLLTFSGGHRESLGQIRPDALASPMVVAHAQGFALGLELREGRYPQVTEIGIKSSDLTTKHALELECSGPLEWWWSLRQCQLFYKGQCTPHPGI